MYKIHRFVVYYQQVLYGLCYAGLSPCVTLCLNMTHIPSVYSIIYSTIHYVSHVKDMYLLRMAYGMSGVGDSFPLETRGTREIIGYMMCISRLGER